jgi:hypothetical protein
MIQALILGIIVISIILKMIDKWITDLYNNED